MSSKAARREYLDAVADFERACLALSERMATITEQPAGPGPVPLLSPFGPRKSAKRARPGKKQIDMSRRAS